MNEWHRNVQIMVDEIDRCIRAHQDEALTLDALAGRMGYSAWYVSRKFSEIAGMSLREYLSARRLAFSLREVRDTQRGLMEIALDYGFSSHEAFTRAFREAYGISPSEYRRSPRPVPLRTLLRPLDCYLAETGRLGDQPTAGDVRTYFVTMPAHRFLHIRNYESIGYWDFWQKQSLIPGQDCDTVCGLLDSITGKLDDLGGAGMDSGSGQVMAFVNAPEGRICSWGIPLAECYGVRLSADDDRKAFEPFQLMDVPEGEYIVFEHGPFDFERENASVEAKIEAAMKDFDYAAAGCMLDMSPGRVFYFYHDCERYWRYVRPVIRLSDGGE